MTVRQLSVFLQMFKKTPTNIMQMDVGNMQVKCIHVLVLVVHNFCRQHAGKVYTCTCTCCL